MKTYRTMHLAVAALAALAADKGDASGAVADDAAALFAAPADDLAARDADLKRREREADLARREAALAASSAAPLVPGEDPAENARHEGRAKARAQLVDARTASTDKEARRALARDLVDLEADDLADLSADLAAHGLSLVDVIKKAAHNAFGVVV